MLAGVIAHALLLVIKLCVTFISAQCYIAYATDRTVVVGLNVIAAIIQVLIGPIIKHFHSLVSEEA